MEELIVTKAKELFFTYGLKAVSMDDIAKHTGVSKKTIYKDFEHKNQLVHQLVTELLLCHKQALDQCSVEARDAVDEVLLSTQAPFNTIAAIHPGFFYELEKFFQPVWQLTTIHRRQVLIPSIIQNLEKGIAAEVYRPEMDIPFVTDLRVQQILTAINPRTFTDRKIPAKKLMLQLSEFYLYGIATPKGKKLINKYINDHNEQQFSI